MIKLLANDEVYRLERMSVILADFVKLKGSFIPNDSKITNDGQTHLMVTATWVFWKGIRRNRKERNRKVSFKFFWGGIIGGGARVVERYA